MKIVEIFNVMNWFRGEHALSIKNVTMQTLDQIFSTKWNYNPGQELFCKFLKVVGWPIRADFKLFCYLQKYTDFRKNGCHVVNENFQIVTKNS